MKPKKRERWLLFDCHYLGRRAQHTTGNLSYGGEKTGTIYGFLRTITEMQERFETTNVIFLFDLGVPERVKILPTYKESRFKKMQFATKQEKRIETQYQIQMRELRTMYLPMIGYRNIFAQNGLEGDDLIAFLCDPFLSGFTTTWKPQIVIVSADKDLYQCIRPGVRMWNPATEFMMTRKHFWKTYQIKPHRWADVKAIAGCHGDDVPGVGGVGEITALKYLRGELNDDCDTFRKIGSSKKKIALNRQLVKLPFVGTGTMTIAPDDVSLAGWRQCANSLGMKSILGILPRRCWGSQ